MRRTELLVIGAGPYGMATAAYAIDRGIDTTIVGRPMGFWREHMPAGMYLRSGVDWHLDATHRHTFEAYLEERGIAAADVAPVPIGVFLDYTDWFRSQKALAVSEVRVESVEAADRGFRAALDDGETIEAAAVVAAPGIASFGVKPDWIGELTPERWAHSCDVIDFDDMAGRRVL